MLTTQIAHVQEVDKKKPVVVKYGLNHVTQLVESGEAQLVVIAHDVDPLELVIWLPALCKKQGIPYCIVKVGCRLLLLLHYLRWLLLLHCLCSQQGQAARSGEPQGASGMTRADARACKARLCGVARRRERGACMQGKARLGQVVNKKTASCCALTAIQSEDQRELAQLVETCKSNYNNIKRIAWGGGIMGPKSQHRTLKRNRALQREAEKRLAVA